MNRRQRVVLGCGLALVLLAALVPPWRFDTYGNTSAETFDVAAGRAPLFAPPEVYFAQGGKVGPERLRVDAGWLLAELALIAGATGLVVLGLGGWRPPPGNL